MHVAWAVLGIMDMIRLYTARVPDLSSHTFVWT